MPITKTAAIALQTEAENALKGFDAQDRVGRLLRSFREAQQPIWTQRDLALRLHCTSSFISDVELGQRSLGFNKISLLVSMLKDLENAQ